MRASLLVVLAVLTLPTVTGGGVEEPVLALVSSGTTSELVRLDPRSLEPAPDVPRVPLGLQDIPWALSPDGSMLAVGSGRSTSLVLVDLRSMQRVGRIATAFSAALAWPTPDRLLLLERGGRRWRFAVLDPIEPRVLTRRGLGARRDVTAAALTRDGLAVLMAPGNRIGAPWLLVLGADGSARRTAVLGLDAGTRKKHIGERVRVWHRSPALAVDTERDVVYVVSAGTRVAEVDLETLAVTTREVRTVHPRLLGGGAEGVESIAASGGNVLATGTVRQARWLGNGSIAVAGWNERLLRESGGRAAVSDDPAGLRLVDTRNWTARRLSAEVRWFHATADSIVAQVPPRRLPGAALVAFTHAGGERFRVELDRVWFGVQTAGPYAYLGLGSHYRPHTVAVLDARTGERIGTPEAPGWVLLLSPSQQQFCWCWTGTNVG